MVNFEYGLVSTVPEIIANDDRLLVINVEKEGGGDSHQKERSLKVKIEP